MALWLLSHGADPNGDEVMYYDASNSTACILRLLIDAGGDVNRESFRYPPLVSAFGAATDRTKRGCCWLSSLLIFPSNTTAGHQSSVHVTLASLHLQTWSHKR